MQHHSIIPDLEEPNIRLKVLVGHLAWFNEFLRLRSHAAALLALIHSLVEVHPVVTVLSARNGMCCVDTNSPPNHLAALQAPSLPLLRMLQLVLCRSTLTCARRE